MQHWGAGVALLELVQDRLDLLVEVLGTIDRLRQVKDHAPANHGLLIIVFDIDVDDVDRVVVRFAACDQVWYVNLFRKSNRE